MDKLVELYDELYNSGILLEHRKNSVSKGITLCMQGMYCIFYDLNQIESFNEETCVIAHELGHCMTGATHRLSSRHDLIEKHEYKANKYAVHKLIPPNEFLDALESGHTEVWQLAEYFNVTESFVLLAYNIYQCEQVI